MRWLTLCRRVALAPLFVAIAPSSCGGGRMEPAPNADLVAETVASGFDTIWELAWGPDQSLWLTERSGVVSRVDPATGTVTRVGQITVTESGESGLMGFDFHPDFPGTPFLYFMHTYTSGGSGLRNRLVRLRYENGALGAPEVLLDDIPGASIHDGSRVVVGPDRFLYVTTGDAANPGLAQNRQSTAGKVLRLTLDGAPAPANPFGDRVFTFGHRNPQGLAFGPDGAAYITEHGPGDNDEVNRLEAGRNFGWPNVRGFCDGDAGSGENTFCQANNVVEPLAAWTPTIAPAGLAYYNSTLIAGWQGSLLFATLKGNALVRLVLSADGRTVVSRQSLFTGTFGRLRDVLVAPDGVVYLATSNKDGRGTPFPLDDRIIRVRPQ